jgi:hypothetical protein
LVDFFPTEIVSRFSASFSLRCFSSYCSRIRFISGELVRHLAVPSLLFGFGLSAHFVSLEVVEECRVDEKSQVHKMRLE